jgi:hypothetical protein
MKAAGWIQILDDFHRNICAYLCSSLSSLKKLTTKDTRQGTGAETQRNGMENESIEYWRSLCSWCSS